MAEDKLIKLKSEAALLKQLLTQEAISSENALVALTELGSIFNKINSMGRYAPLGRIRVDRLFIEGDLANNIQLADCYNRFANLVEGIDV